MQMSDGARRLVRRIGIAGLCAYGPMVLIHAVCITGLGFWTIAGVELFILVPVLAGFVAVAALPFLVPRRTRAQAIEALLIGVVIAALFVPAFVGSIRLRSFGFYLAARRAAPIVAAVERYVADRGGPPVNLGDLVPAYLPALPSRLPDLRIIVGDKAREEFGGNDWVLFTIVSSGLINWDQFIYYPNQQYPRTGHGGWLERIDRWAYVHE
jgi:hypothetical protein